VRKFAASLLAAKTGVSAEAPETPGLDSVRVDRLSGWVDAAPARIPYALESIRPPSPAEPPWLCAFCGMENTGGETCYYCNAARPDDALAIPHFVQPAPSTDVFLLNPRNMAFVLGQTRRLASAGYGCVMLFFIPFLVVGAFFLVYGVKSVYEWQQLTTEGVTTRAKFIDRSISTDSDGDDTYYVTFQFGLDNRTYGVEQSVDSSTYYGAETGVIVDIVYVPANPQLARIAGMEAGEEEIFLVVFSLCWNGIVLLIFLSVVAGWRRVRRLSREGQIVRGELVSASGRRGNKGNYFVTVNYRFRTPGGEELSGKETATRNDLRGRELPAPGTPLSILYKDRKTHMAL
jgi:hypothetical protein